MKKIYWMILAIFLLLSRTAHAETVIDVSKPSLENRAIQDLKVIVKDDRSRMLRVDFILVRFIGDGL